MGVKELLCILLVVFLCDGAPVKPQANMDKGAAMTIQSMQEKATETQASVPRVKRRGRKNGKARKRRSNSLVELKLSNIDFNNMDTDELKKMLTELGSIKLQKNKNGRGIGKVRPKRGVDIDTMNDAELKNMLDDLVAKFFAATFNI